MLNKWSSIRRKTVYTLLFSTLALAMVIAAASIFILLPGYTRLEENIVRGDLQTTLTALSAVIEDVRQTAVDWSARSETALASSPSQDIGRLDALLILSRDGEVLSAREAGEENGPAWAERLKNSPELLAPGGQSGPLAGLVVFPDSTWVIALQPVHAQTSGAAAGGWVLAGRSLDSAELARLAGMTGSQLQVFRQDEPNLPADGTAVLPALQGSGAVRVQAVNNTEIAGYALLDDLAGGAGLLLRLSEGRTIYNQGRVSIAIFLATMLGAVALFTLVVSRSLDREVIDRLEEMSGGIQKIREDKDFSQRIHLPGDDELADLAGGINDTIEALETSTQALKENQQRLAHEGLHDALTGLANRVHFIQRLNQALALLEVERVSQVAVLFLDLDGFKLINESYDHPFGDRILVAAGDRVRYVLRGDDFIARLGGDEFGVLLEDLHTTEEAERVAQRILEEIRRPFELDGHMLFLTASLGIAATTHVMRGEELLRNADMAMYTAKDRGKNGYAIFDTQMHSDALERLNLENDLRRALERDEFMVYYQPIVSLFDGKVTALEALMRWRHPERGLVLPDGFLHVIKEAGLMNAMNQVLFRKAFGQLSDWRAQGLTDLHLAINVSARTLPESSFWDLFERELYAAGIPPSVIQIEVVESEMAASIDMTLVALERLKSMGVTISVDDFGTGYSSLAYLKRLPIHCLKIDRTFIKDVIQNRDDAAIVSAMIVMAHVLQLDVVAEGVETEGQFRFLLDQSCEKAQGYLLAHPEPPENLTELLLSGKRLLPENDPS